MRSSTRGRAHVLNSWDQRQDIAGKGSALDCTARLLEPGFVLTHRVPRDTQPQMLRVSNSKVSDMAVNVYLWPLSSSEPPGWPSGHIQVCNFVPLPIGLCP